MKNLKPTYLLFACLIASFTSNAQLRLPALDPDLKNALEKVIEEYPRQFSGLKGEILHNNPQTTEYASLLKMTSAQKNTITQHSGSKPVYSWQAVMFTTESFEEAEKKYRSLYKQLKAISLRLNRDYHYGLEGSYEAPDLSKDFVGTVFSLAPNPSNLPKVKVELLMQYELMEWKIYLNLFQKEREDDEQGRIIED